MVLLPLLWALPCESEVLQTRRKEMSVGKVLVGSARKLLSIEPPISYASPSASPVPRLSRSTWFDNHAPHLVLNSSQAAESHLRSNGTSDTSSFASPYDMPTHFNPSMAIVIVVLLSAFFFMGFFSVYVRRCTTDDEFDGNDTNSRGAGVRRQERPPQGLDRAIVDDFPVVTFSAVKDVKEVTECIVCLCEFEEDEALRLLTPCGHTFHQDCIDMWLFSHTTCPLCRRSLLFGREDSANEATTNTSTLNVGAGGTMRPSERDAEEALDNENLAVVITVDSVLTDTMQSGRDEELETQTTGTTDGTAAYAGARNLPTDSVRDQPSSSDDAAARLYCDSPIFGVTEDSPSGSTRKPSRSGELRRSHSTGHSFVKGNGHHLIYSTPASSHSETHQPISLLSPLLMSDFHRSRSYTMLSDLWGAQETSFRVEDNFGLRQQIILHPSNGDTVMRADREDMKGCSYYLRRPFSSRKTYLDARASLFSGTSMAEALCWVAPNGLNPEGKSAMLSPTSLRIAFKRLAGRQKREEASSSNHERHGEFLHFAYVL